MNYYPIADLTDEKKQRIKQLEQELDVILIAYNKEEGDSGYNAVAAYIDDPNINMI
jgi:hypothetical protein